MPFGLCLACVDGVVVSLHGDHLPPFVGSLGQTPRWPGLLFDRFELPKLTAWAARGVCNAREAGHAWHGAARASASVGALFHCGDRLIGCIECNGGVGGYLFLGLLAFSVDLTWPLDPSFLLLFSAATALRAPAAALRVSALTVNAARRALCVALRWLARRFISLALFLPSIGSSTDGECSA